MATGKRAQELIEEQFENRLTQSEGFHELVQDVLESVRTRFDLIKAEELIRKRSGWPELWLFKSNDRKEFIRNIRWFSSNYWPQFGRLLTPLVEASEFVDRSSQIFLEASPKLALIDGQGFGAFSGILRQHHNADYPALCRRGCDPACR